MMAAEKKSSTPNRPFLRRIVVTLGPLEEWRGKSRGEIVQFKSDGTLEGLRVTGTFQKTLMGMPQPSQISIYNLSRDTRNAIKGSLTKITVEAGWNNTDLRKVFQGSIMSSSSERSGPDIVTKLVAGVWFARARRQFRDLRRGHARERRGAEAGVRSAGDDGAGREFSGGRREYRAARVELRGRDERRPDPARRGTRLLVERAGRRGDGLGSYVELNGENGGLISIAPTLTGPMQIQSGVKIKALYVPGISAGHSIKVNSTLNPRLSGTYRIHTMSINIDAYSEAWTMDIESFRFPPGKK